MATRRWSLRGFSRLAFRRQKRNAVRFLVLSGFRENFRQEAGLHLSFNRKRTSNRFESRFCSSGMLTARFFRSAVQRRAFATLREQAPRVEPIDLYEPKLKARREFPDYEVVNVRLQGHDYSPLEKFQSYVHKMAKRFDFEVVDSYAVTAQSERIVTYKPASTVVDSELDLKLFDRWVRLRQVPTVRLPIFAQLLRTHAPPGVRITIKEHEKADEDYRYIPDMNLKKVQNELKSLDDPAVRRNLGWE
ncbi:39S ribosomal protein L48, mitochondrial [Aphelenchoides fujianensis]|nr:39S ribosomal protein L48, mitochondrial [Aphelenchoides fujianensis]